MNDAASSPDAVLATDLVEALGGEFAVERVHRLTGGASRETFRVERSGAHTDLILQRERGETTRRTEGMAAEADIIRAAAAAGVPVPTVVASNRVGEVTGAAEPSGALGKSWFCTEAVEGETIARKILRDDAYIEARAALPRQLGAALAAVHTIDPAPLAWLENEDELSKYRVIADELGLASPAFELAFRWLDQHRPATVPARVVHGDFRLGNLIVDRTGLASVIDWELAHMGDPMEDLGWLCVKAWRFGSPHPVAGLGPRAELFAGYEAASGHEVDARAVHWWEVLGSLKWGVMCAIQANAHLSGDYRSVELAAIGRRVTEQEHDLMQLLGQAVDA